MLEPFTVLTAEFPDMPEFARIISIPRKTIYINLSAKKYANVDRLLTTR